jgi:hypothetical protein
MRRDGDDDAGAALLCGDDVRHVKQSSRDWTSVSSEKLVGRVGLEPTVSRLRVEGINQFCYLPVWCYSSSIFFKLNSMLCVFASLKSRLHSSSW